MYISLDHHVLLFVSIEIINLNFDTPLEIEQ